MGKLGGSVVQIYLVAGAVSILSHSKAFEEFVERCAEYIEGGLLDQTLAVPDASD